MIVETNWEVRWLALADHVARWSKDPETKVGAVIVGQAGRHQHAFGYNGLPPGLEDTDERLNDPERSGRWVRHAEENALANALFDTQGATLYSTRWPCERCTLAILAHRVGRVVAVWPPPDDPKWKRANRSWLMMTEAGVATVKTPLTWYERYIGAYGPDRDR